MGRGEAVDYTVIPHSQSPSVQSNTENITVYATLLHNESVAGYTELQGGAILPTAHPESVSSSEVSTSFPDPWSLIPKPDLEVVSFPNHGHSFPDYEQ